MSRIIANDFKPSQPAEVVQRAVKPAEGAQTEMESRLLNALRKQRFGSAGALAKFTKQDDSQVCEALTDLIGRGLVRWQDESIGTAGSGYVATDFGKSTPSSTNDKARVLGVRSWIDSLDTM